jgi:hypothetical protein
MDSYVGKLVNFYCTKDEEKSQLKDLIFDFFIRENNGIFNSLQNEELICKILSNLQTLNIEENLTPKSKVKLQDSIYSLTRPGNEIFLNKKQDLLCTQQELSEKMQVSRWTFCSQ